MYVCMYVCMYVYRPDVPTRPGYRGKGGPSVINQRHDKDFDRGDSVAWR
jgi:hypothetical protein